jgi:ribokinase
VAAARLGANVTFISKIGADHFGQMAQTMYATEKVDARYLVSSSEHTTGAAAIIVDDATGENAIIVTPGAANALTKPEIDAAREQIRNSAVFMTQLELPLETVEHGLRLARELGVPTILNPAPACKLSDSLLQLCDFLTPNETEAEELTGQSIVSLADAEKAADTLLRRGVSTVILTLGARGAFVRNSQGSQHIPAFQAGPVIDTTGAGDAFNGGFAVAFSEGKSIPEAVRFGCAVAGISVTRPGTAPSMPTRAELEALWVLKDA